MIIINYLYYVKLYNMNSVHKDLFFFSFNEGAKDYTLEDCSTIFTTIMLCSPKIIVICTQESLAEGKTHFQHILNTLLEPTKYKRLLKYDASSKSATTISILTKSITSKLKNKNVRTRVYYNTENVINNIITNSESTSMMSRRLSTSFSNILSTKKFEVIQEKESYSNKNVKLNNNTKLYVTEIGASESKRSGFKSSLNATLYKGSICIRLVIQSTNNNTYKFIFVNSHLLYKKTGNTGEDIRTKEFISLCKEFKLAKFYKLGYNILFSGDLNFRLFRSNEGNMNESLAISTKIINTIEINNKHSISNLSQRNELYLIIDKIIKTIKEEKNENELNKLYKFIPIMNKNSKDELLDLFKTFMENFELFGIHLTCKFKENFKNNDAKSCNAKFNCNPNGYARVPSMCDKILVADHGNIDYNKEDFKVIKESTHSDHLPIIFTCNFLLHQNIETISLRKQFTKKM